MRWTPRGHPAPRAPGGGWLTLAAGALAGGGLLAAVSCAIPRYEATGSLDGGGGGRPDSGTAGGTCVPTSATGAGNQIWSHSFGGLQADMASGVAVDPEGNVAITGTFRSAASFDGKHTLVAKGQDVFVAKYDPAGKHLWSRQAVGEGDQFATGLAALADGSVVVTGAFFESIDFGCGADESVGGDDIFVVKLDACGGCVWQRVFGGAASDQVGRAVAVDAEGSVLVTGSFAGVVPFDPQAPLATAADRQNVFIVKLDRNGKHVWSLGFGDETSDQVGTAIAVDPDGHVLVTGAYAGTLSFDDGSGDLLAGEGQQLFVVRRKGDGSPVWSRGFGGDGDQIGTSIAVGPASAEPAKRGVVVTGANGGTIDFGMGTVPLTSAWQIDGFVAKLNYLGTTLWSVGIGDVSNMTAPERGDQVGTSVVLDAKAQAVVAGSFDGAISVLGNNVTAPAARDVDAFLLRLDAEGALAALSTFGDVGPQFISSVALGATNVVHVTGGFRTSIQLTKEPLESAGDYDIFLAKLGP